MTIVKMLELFKENKLFIGRMISGSKQSPPGHICVFNANIIVRSCGKIWYGDIDITKDGNKLKKLADIFGEPMFVLRESGCRFGTENDNVGILMGRAVWSTAQEIPTEA